MNNKVLVELIVPEIDKKFSILLPINKRIGNIIVLLNKALYEIDNNYTKTNNALYNRETGKKYDVNDLLYYTDIRNGAALVLI